MKVKGSSLDAAYTLVHWSDELAEKFTFTGTYDELPTKVFLDTGGNPRFMGLPRGAGVRGTPHTDERELGFAVNFNTTLFKPQKPEQLRVIQESVELLKADEQFIVSAPTGWGKTYVGAQIAGLMGRRFCVITTKDDIVNQWRDAIKATLGLEDEEIGIWRGHQVPKHSHKAVVGLVQSLMKGVDRYGASAYTGFGLVLCDEVHRMGAEGFSQAMWHFPAKYRLGMSATPFRKDGKDQVFQWHIGPVRVEATMEVLVPKVLYHQSGWKIPRSANGEKIPHDFGNISLLLKPIGRNHERNALIVQYLHSTYERGRNCIAFSDNLEHLTIIADMLRAKGIPEEKIGYYVGAPNDVYKSKGKAAQLKERGQHRYRQILLSTYKMASEATNIPWLDTVIMMTPKANVEQIVGRIRREYDDKKPPVVIDIVDRDSLVLSHYAKARLRWYKELGCDVKFYS
jgi:superfamily II DNA or RNA helicase